MYALVSAGDVTSWTIRFYQSVELIERNFHTQVTGSAEWSKVDSSFGFSFGIDGFKCASRVLSHAREGFWQRSRLCGVKFFRSLLL